MSAAGAEPVEDGDATAPPFRRGRKKLIIIAAAALLVIAAGGGATAWYFKQRADAEAEAADGDAGQAARPRRQGSAGDRNHARSGAPAGPGVRRRRTDRRGSARRRQGRRRR